MTFDTSGAFIYKCSECGKEMFCYVDKKVTDNERPTPFIILCPYCKGRSQDVSNKIGFPLGGMTIRPFDKDKERNQGIFLLLDSELQKHGDMACGHLHINKEDKIVSVYTNEEYKK